MSLRFGSPTLGFLQIFITRLGHSQYIVWLVRNCEHPQNFIDQTKVESIMASLTGIPFSSVKNKPRHHVSKWWQMQTTSLVIPWRHQSLVVERVRHYHYFQNHFVDSVEVSDDAIHPFD
jgi:hypothetical protein